MASLVALRLDEATPGDGGRALEVALRLLFGRTALLEPPVPPALERELLATGAEDARAGYERLVLLAVRREVVPWALT